MKKITHLLIVCSLALAGAVTAQEPTPEESPGSKKQRPDKKAPAEVKPTAPRAPKTEAPAVAPKTEAPPVKEPAATRAPAVPKPEKKAPDAPKPAPAATTETKTQEPATSATPDAKKKQSEKRSSEATKSPAASADTSPSATAATRTTATATPATKTTATATPASAKATATPATAAASATPAAKATATPAAATTASATPAAATTASATPATATTASATPAAATTASATPAAAATASAAPSIAQTSPNPAAAKKPEPQKIEQIRQRHANFTAQPRPDRVPAVTFSSGYRIQGSDQWQGPQYEVYRSYRPERHDQAYYRSRYQRVELIAGGYYYFHNNYWYPAWGYNPTNEYYAYDAPIYAGKRALPPDKVIANVQAVLQEMGYYKGEVDGLLGPLTRAALTGYQTDQGMVVTAVIDEPTLDSLGMG
ncbi:MAG TPA: peptidoglycan-binding protein [Chthoniobacterales bacterium]|nr:peptidoglycan-binding protein [Chthoniobacterales bacterium]